MTAKQLTQKYTEFDQSRLDFTELIDNERSKGQRIAYPRYNHPTKGENQQLMLQTPKMKIFTYGVPRIGEYYSSDKDRSFLKLPIDLSDTEVKSLYDQLHAFDERMSSPEMRKILFDKKAKKFKYIGTIRRHEVEEDQDEKAPYMKLKMDTSYPDDEVKTEVWCSTQNDEGKRERTQLSVSTVDEFSEHVRYQSNVRIIMRPVKLWASANPTPQYGVTWKMMKVEVEPPTTGTSSLSSFYNNDAFVDSDEEEITPGTTVNVQADESEESDESDSDSDSEDNSTSLNAKK